MSNEFLTRNSLSSHNSSTSNSSSNSSSSSSSSSSSNSAYSNSKHSSYGQPIIGQGFISSIHITDLAIQSNTYEKPTTSEPDIQKVNEKKIKRHVTFNLDDIQVRTIPVYSSSSSLSSSSSSLSFLSDLLLESSEEEEGISSSCSFHVPPISEKISKNTSHDSLQQRRHDHHHVSTIKPAYWYSLNPSSREEVSSNDMLQHTENSPSLELAEHLIHETIQREMALNPHLSNYTPSFPHTMKTESSMMSTPFNPSTETNPHKVISDSEDEEIFSVVAPELNDMKERQESIPENQSNEHGPESTDPSFSSIYIIDNPSEDSDTSFTTTTSPEPSLDAIFKQNMVELETDFEKSVYSELARRYNQEIIPYTEYQPPQLTFPFEQKYLSISNKDEHVITTLKEQQTIVPLSFSNSSLHLHNRQKRQFFFVKVLKAENLDFPIDNDYTNVYCSIRYKNIESKSLDKKMAHTINMNHEMKIENIDPDEQIVITIHVATNYKKTNQAHGQSSWYHKSKSISDLDRYVHEKEGSICQTVFSASRFMTHEGIDQTAALMLINNWYKPYSISTTSSSSSSLLGRTSSITRKKSTKSVHSTLVREKAVGKLYIECLYITTHGDYIPRDIEEVIDALNAKRFYQTDWQTGYLFQLNEDTKIFKRRYFKLTGGYLFAYPNNNTSEHQQALYKIPISQVNKLVRDNFIIVERSKQRRAKTTSLLDRLETVIMMNKEEENEENSSQDELRYGFQLIFNNGEQIQFNCESLEECNRWVAVIEVMICRLPNLPSWII